MQHRVEREENGKVNHVNARWKKERIEVGEGEKATRVLTVLKSGGATSLQPYPKRLRSSTFLRKLIAAALDTEALNSLYTLSRSVIAEGVRCFETVPCRE